MALLLLMFSVVFTNGNLGNFIENVAIVNAEELSADEAGMEAESVAEVAEEADNEKETVAEVEEEAEIESVAEVTSEPEDETGNSTDEVTETEGESELEGGDVPSYGTAPFVEPNAQMGEDANKYEYVAIIDSQEDLSKICEKVSGRLLSYEYGVAVIEAGYLQEEERNIDGYILAFNEEIQGYDPGYEYSDFGYGDYGNETVNSDSEAPENGRGIKDDSDGYYAQAGTNYSQYHINDLNLEMAWKYSKGSGVRVAVLDSGIDFNHPALKDNIEEAITLFTEEDYTKSGSKLYNGTLGREYDYYYHGTYVAGLIAANAPDKSVMGIAPQAKLISVKVFEATNEKKTTSSTAKLISGFRAAIERDVDIINLSLTLNTGLAQSTYDSVEQVVNEATQKGIIVVCASGNHSSSSIRYPAACANSIAIGAVEKSGDSWTRAYFSNYGTGLDFMMPGYGIESTVPTENPLNITYSHNGTSYSCPIAVGTIALLKAKCPDKSKSEIYDALAETALDLGAEGYDVIYGYGMMQPYEALEKLANIPDKPSPTPIPTPEPTPAPNPAPDDGGDNSDGGDSSDGGNASDYDGNSENYVGQDKAMAGVTAPDYSELSLENNREKSDRATGNGKTGGNDNKDENTDTADQNNTDETAKISSVSDDAKNSDAIDNSTINKKDTTDDSGANVDMTDANDTVKKDSSFGSIISNAIKKMTSSTEGKAITGIIMALILLAFFAFLFIIIWKKRKDKDEDEANKKHKTK